MPAERYFIKQSFSDGQFATLTGSEFNHLAKVMRTRTGELVELVNGQGQLAHARVEEILKNEAMLAISHVMQEKPRSTKVILAQALVKPNRLDLILEKGTELGVDEVWLFPGQNSLKSDLSSNQSERLHAIMIAAMKQCGRLFLPRLVQMPPLKKWPALSGIAFFGDVSPDAPLLAQALQESPQASSILFFVGPESGFTQQEIDELKGRKVKGVKLHQNILRTETAPLVALSLIEHQLLMKLS